MAFLKAAKGKAEDFIDLLHDSERARVLFCSALSLFVGFVLGLYL